MGDRVLDGDGGGSVAEGFDVGDISGVGEAGAVEVGLGVGRCSRRFTRYGAQIPW